MMSKPNPAPAGLSRLEEFNHYFELAPAVSQAQRNMVYHIRYRVYCEEFGYESPESSSNGEEIDEFDDQSAHCLVTHRQSGVPVGCVRVVMLEGDDRLPMEIHAGDSLHQAYMDEFATQRNVICEISRLAVDSAFRRRNREQSTRFGNIDAVGAAGPELRSLPLVALSLMVGAGALADVVGRKHCFAIMEPFLPVMMRRAGIHFRRVGEDFEFRGVRAPYYGDMSELFNNAPEELRQYFNLMRSEFAATLQARPLFEKLPHET